MLVKKQKYFIALVMETPWQNEIMDLKKLVSENYKSKGALKSPAHITLQMPFEWADKKKSKLVEQLKLFAATQNSFEYELQNFDFFEPRVVFVNVVKNEQLENLQKALQTHLKLNLKLFASDGKLRGFHPHVTIGFRDLKSPQFYEAKKHFSERTFYAKITCNSIALLKHDGKVWEVEEAFPLVMLR
jgi:2'-5' RNA ligase